MKSRRALTLAVPAAIISRRRTYSIKGGFDTRLRLWLSQELDRRTLFNLLPVAFGCGILLFFAAEGNPSPWPGLVGALICLAAALLAKNSFWARTLLIGSMTIFLGFACASLRVRLIEAPVLGKVIIAPISGFVESIEARAGGTGRLVIRPVSITGLEPSQVPQRIRVTSARLEALKPGDFIEARARLLPLPEAARPGGYDFARDAYFQGIGAVGSLLGDIMVRAPIQPPDRMVTIAAIIDEARNHLTDRIAQAIGGQAGALAAALVTGKRGLIDEETNDALRAAGLYHIVSISGLHMVLASGIFFWLARALLALFPQAALLWPIKKIAAVIAMVGASAYCIFSGAEVATLRSLIMTLVMLGAILCERPALSMRNLAISALIVLSFEPETLLGPSFQMSFGAVAALIAVAQWHIQRTAATREDTGLFSRWRARITTLIVGSLLTTLVASLATGPFGAFHFQTFNPYGLIGNGLALPLMSFIVMPAAVIGVLAFPFGLDAFIWQIMGFASAQVVAISHWIEGFGGANMVVPAFGTAALLLLASALVILTLLTTPLRAFAFLPLATGTWLAAHPERPVLFIDREGKGAALRNLDGRLAILGRPGDFITLQWLRTDGDSRTSDAPSLKEGTRCDALGCTASLPGFGFVAYVRDEAALERDCRLAAILITPLSAPSCKAALVIDRTILERSGALAIHARNGNLVLQGTRRTAEDRPWLKTP